ncbi:MBG domain-containing protein, partial [Salegentibacter salinarum]|uniref:MBG domain-containing protein n=1 Tax=Salegentibacter salinarum TaxID=447422 RepID=UPI0012FF06F6
AVGIYSIDLGSLSAGANYTIDFAGADFAINAKVLMVTADPGQNKVYGDADPIFTYTATGFENGDDASILSGSLTREVGEAVGIYTIGLGSLSAGVNYTIDYTGADFTIGTKVLSVTADTDQSKIYGETDPEFTYTATGFENEDDASIL